MKKSGKRKSVTKSWPNPAIKQTIHNRNTEILLMLVDGYIKNTVPISSQYITQQPGIKLSSASVRSIFANLECEGYLFSPHKSAGRIPTEKAWGYYVSKLSLSSSNYVQEEDKCYIQNEYLRQNLSIDDILSATARIMSILTRYATLIVGTASNGSVLKHIELIDMGTDELMLILVTRAGRVLSRRVYMEEHISQDILRDIAYQLSQTFQGIDLKDLCNEIIAKGKSSKQRYYATLANALEKNIRLMANEQTLYKEGFDQLYGQLEEGSFRYLSNLLSQDNSQHALWQEMDNSELDVFIGGDYDNRLAGISLISGSYKMAEKRVGSINIIGPNCMDYRRVLSLVEYVRFVISNMLTRLSN